MDALFKIVGLGLLVGGGYYAYTTFRQKEADRDLQMAQDFTMPSGEQAAAEYEQVAQDWDELIGGVTTAAGHQLFDPLSTNPENPLTQYKAVVKRKSGYAPWPKGVATSLPPKGYGEIYLWNPRTDNEFTVKQLATSLKNQGDFGYEDAIRAIKQTFANAFNYSCKINPIYDAVAGQVVIPKNTFWGSSKPWPKQNDPWCDTAYPLEM